MRGRPATKVYLSDKDREKIRELLRRSTCTVAEQRRGRIILLAAEGLATTQIAEQLNVDPKTVSRWRTRIACSEIDENVERSLADAARSGRPPVIDALTRSQIIAASCDPLPDGQGLSGWTLDLLVEEASIRSIPPVSRSSIHRILSTFDMHPHRQRMWLHSPDPMFREKVAEIVELYLNPPAGSIVLSYDEKTGIQATERKHPDRPARPGQIARHEFEYIRHGTQSLLATLNVHTGEVIADCGPTRTAEDMERHFERVAEHYPHVNIHVVLDNLNIHKGERWKRFNERHHGRFQFHYTPLHASWVNQIELFFGVLGRRCLRRKSFCSTDELAAHVLAFIARWNRKDRKPFRWTFAGFGLATTTETLEKVA
jgi:transposase/DNA-binding CsgD family transcriptional regulator